MPIIKIAVVIILLIISITAVSSPFPICRHSRRNLFFLFSLLLLLFCSFLRCLFVLLFFSLLGEEGLEINDLITMVDNTPSELFERDCLKQIILTVPQVDADFALEHISTIEVERRPPRLHLARILLLTLLLLFIFIVVFLALGYRWPGLYS
jgi:hypothetical protein